VIKGSAEERRLVGRAAGALDPEEREAGMLEQIEKLSRIATVCENETRAVLNAVGGKVDPTMDRHSLFGHRSAASVKKGMDIGDIVDHERYTIRGWTSEKHAARYASHACWATPGTNLTAQANRTRSIYLLSNSNGTSRRSTRPQGRANA
jgi:hypothetical protein